MPRLLPRPPRLPAALLAVLAATHVGAWADNRAVMQPAPGVEVSYERLGAEDATSPPGRFDGSVATPAGTLRTSVRAVPGEERNLQRGDTTFELPSLLGGQLQLRDLEAGGTSTRWRTKLGTGLAAETRGERTPVRKGQSLQLQRDFGGGNVAQALVSRSTTLAAQGSRWDLEVTRVTGLGRWTVGVDAAERTYVSSSGGLEPRAAVRVGTQWPMAPNAKMEASISRQARWDAEERVSSFMLGTRFQLPRRASLATGVETDAEAHHKASVTLTVPLEPR